MTNAVELRGVGKRFTKYVDTPTLVSAAMRLRSRTRREKHWAIRGVDLDVTKGECVGVIGRNGSGKSTLMTMIAGITAPTEGSVKAWGRVAPLISVGVGFHRELTGRENVYVNGSILGLSKRQIDERADAIIGFAELEDFIDTPVKFYSSGMFVRLGFAVAVHSEPDVLIVDEVLAVGDLAFQVKCFDRMNLIRQGGATVVVVSHHMGMIRRMCERVLLVHDGEPRYSGLPEDAISAFHELMSTSREAHLDRTTGLRFEPGVVGIENVELRDASSTPTGHFDAGERATLCIKARALQELDDVVVRMLLFAPDGTQVYVDSTAGNPLGAVRASSVVDFSVDFPMRLPTGSYQVVVQLDRPDLRTTLCQSSPCSFFVTGRHTVAGITDLEASFTREAASSATPEGPSSTPPAPSTQAARNLEDPDAPVLSGHPNGPS